jgi:hypothetical protein
MNETLAQHNGWTFDPTREVWFVRTSANTWTEVKGALDNPPSWTAQSEIDRHARQVSRVEETRN